MIIKLRFFLRKKNKYIYIYIHVCVCVCIHTHTHTYIYILSCLWVVAQLVGLEVYSFPTQVQVSFDACLWATMCKVLVVRIGFAPGTILEMRGSTWEFPRMSSIEEIKKKKKKKYIYNKPAMHFPIFLDGTQGKLGSNNYLSVTLSRPCEANLQPPLMCNSSI